MLSEFEINITSVDGMITVMFNEIIPRNYPRK